MGLYVNSSQGLQMVSGRGKAEYGASTIRTGTFTNPTIAAESSAIVDVQFAEPMPDAFYMLDISRKATDSAGAVCYTIKNKTANGFTVIIARPNGSPLTANLFNCDYTAFKLYTDNEYNELLKLSRPDLWPVNTEIDLGDGLYGKRYTGIFNGAATSELLDNSIQSPNCKLIDFRIWQQRRGGSNDYLQLLGCPYSDGSTQNILQLANTGLYVYHTWGSASDYDIWVTYTKTT